MARCRSSSCSAARSSTPRREACCRPPGARGSKSGARGGGLWQTARISWEKEAEFRMPVRLWKEMMDHYFPNSAYVRPRKDDFDELYDYQGRNGLPTWAAAAGPLARAPQGRLRRARRLQGAKRASGRGGRRRVAPAGQRAGGGALSGRGDKD